ncbi:uncharacterized G-patch domain protein DDB_G0278987-like [Macrobrachium nipponense]|uniref:uncharacterized G-patch domain protein DDB_G0278987-like n=1 Tax=Macrobrachium nipponense TaxID=159736 RepID=UPI0030C8027C
MLLEAWKGFEDEFGDKESESKDKQLMPRKVTRRRQVTTEDGSQSRWEEFVDYIFPDDEAAKPSLLLLAKAKEWAKKQQVEKDNDETQDVKGDKEGYEETAPLDPNIDRDDSEVEIGTTSSESSSESEEKGKDARKEKIHKRKSSGNLGRGERMQRAQRRESFDTSSSSSSDENNEKVAKERKSSPDKERQERRSSDSSDSSGSDDDERKKRKRSSSESDSSSDDRASSNHKKRSRSRESSRNRDKASKGKRSSSDNDS